jgi:hypothetical protein
MSLWAPQKGEIWEFFGRAGLDPTSLQSTSTHTIFARRIEAHEPFLILASAHPAVIIMGLRFLRTAAQLS